MGPRQLPADDREELVAALFAERFDETVRLGWALTGDASLAQELAQEAFVRVYVHRRQLRDPAAAPAYLRRTLVNLVISDARRTNRTVPGDGAVERRSVDAVAPQLGDRIDMARALATLPPRRRACVVLRYYLDLNEADTAAAMGVSVGTVKSQTHKALAQLRTQLRVDDLPLERKDAP